MLTHDDPRVRDSGRLLEPLHRELAAGGRAEVRFGRPVDAGPAKRIFLASTAVAAQKAAQHRETDDVYAKGGHTHEGRPSRHPAVGPRHRASSARRINPKKEAS